MHSEQDSGHSRPAGATLFQSDIGQGCVDAHGGVVGSLVSMTHVSVGTDAGQLRSCWTMVTGQINSLMPDTILQQILTKKPGVEDEKVPMARWWPVSSTNCHEVT